MEKTPSSRKSLLVIIQFFARVVGGRGVEVGVGAYLSLSGRIRSGVGAYSRLGAY